jgi:hypothetical protein
MGRVLRGIRNILLLARANPVIAAIALLVVGGCWHRSRTKQAQQQRAQPIESICGQQLAENPIV